MAAPVPEKRHRGDGQIDNNDNENNHANMIEV